MIPSEIRAGIEAVIRNLREAEQRAEEMAERFGHAPDSADGLAVRTGVLAGRIEDAADRLAGLIGLQEGDR